MKPKLVEAVKVSDDGLSSDLRSCAPGGNLFGEGANLEEHATGAQTI